MTEFLIALGFCLWFLAMMYLAITAIEDYRFPKMRLTLAFILLVLGLGAFIEGDLRESKRGPCLEYQTQMHFNPATKTMMPARICVSRGEWIE